jgi:hypothetical protein
MTSAAELVESAFAQLRQRIELTEQQRHDVEGGQVLVLAGGPVAVAVAVTLRRPGFEGGMLYAFTAPQSAAPHLGFDTGAVGPARICHLDLIPRIDLATDIGYVDAVYGPLTAAADAAADLPGVSPAHLPRRQRALLSPWMISCVLADPTAPDPYDALAPVVSEYVEQWCAVALAGAPSAVDPAELAARDRRTRPILFSPDVDEVWAGLEVMLGPDVGRVVLDIVQGVAQTAAPA